MQIRCELDIRHAGFCTLKENILKFIVRVLVHWKKKKFLYSRQPSKFGKGKKIIALKRQIQRVSRKPP